MRYITAPQHLPLEVYQLCINSIENINLRSRLDAIKNHIVDASNDYELKGNTNQLHEIPQNHVDNEGIVEGAVTKRELKDVYSTHMVGQKKPARIFYDHILYSAPLNRCPFCGMGQVSTLDHYLPKSKYPLLAVTPLNLIPSCKDCNTGKSTSTSTTADQQSLHPYFEEKKIFSEQWLFARVVPTSPETIEFFVDPPQNWDAVSKSRVQSHFSSFKLASRFSIESANEIASQRLIFEKIKLRSIDELIELVKDYAESHYRTHVNSWRTAFYQALFDYYSAQKY